MRRATGVSPKRLASLLVGLYPAAWRKRYGTEILALLEDDPPSLRGLGTLLAGAADAHLRPQCTWTKSIAPAVRARLSLSALFCCWIAVSMIGIGFQKEIEDPAFSRAAAHHTLLGLAHDTVLAGALLGAAAIAIGGLPLLGQALLQAFGRRDRPLQVIVVLPLAALACFAALTRLLVALAPSGSLARSTWIALAVLVPWWLAGLACATACALAPRLALARLAPSADALRWSSRAGVVLAAAMMLVTAGLIAYVLVLVPVEPRLSGQSGGPVWPSTGLVLAIGALGALASTAIALLSVGRSRRALAEA